MCDCDCDCVSREEIDQILEEVSQLRGVQEKQAKRIETLEAERDELGVENERLTERVAELEDDVEELNSEADARDARMDAMSNWIESTNDTVDELEADVATIDAGGGQPSGPTVDDGIDRDELTLVEKYAEMPPEERAEVLPASQRRAVVIYEYWNEWSRSGRTGRSLRTADIRSKLETVEQERTGTDVRLESKQVLRAADELERLSEERIQKNRCSGGDYLRLVQDEDDTFPSRDAAASQTGVTASSASA
jgi:outer membrane murein-binding lipoprotein Lpp